MNAVIPPPQETGFGIPVYWPGDHPHTEIHNSARYPLSPRSVKLIYGTLKHQVSDKGKLLMDKDLERNLAPDDIVKALVSQAGDKGLVALTGDPVMDEQLKAEGRRLWNSYRLAQCIRIVSAHEIACARAALAGILPPRPTADWKLAKRDLERLEQVAVDRKRYVCTKDGMDFDTPGEVESYCLKSYPGTDPKTIFKDSRPTDPVPDEAFIARVAPEPEPEQVPEQADENGTLAATVKDIFTRAGAEGVTLPPELRADLLSDEPDIVQIAIGDANAILDGPPSN
jgi:hypothetical protein